jgi:hypothetical protein
MIGDFINPKSRQNNISWDAGNNPLWLFTPKEICELPLGFIITSISGKEARIGIDPIDMDTRFGYTAFGIKESELHPVIQSTKPGPT